MRTPQTPLGRWIREHRERVGLSQNRLARKAGVTAKCIAYVEEGVRHRGCSARTLLSVASVLREHDPALDVSVEALLPLVSGTR